MDYNDARRFLATGHVIRSNSCDYKLESGVLYWRWMGEEQWTCPISDGEKRSDWELII